MAAILPSRSGKMATMAILKIDELTYDFDLHILRRLLEVIDAQIAEVDTAVATSKDPDGDGLFDWGNALYGLGFVACQQYLNATYKHAAPSMKRKDAIRRGPKFSAELFCAEVVDAAANYWKHQGEWDGTGWQEKQTRAVLDAAYPSKKDYVMANVLYELLGKPASNRLCSILPRLEEWRHDLAEPSEDPTS
jgi:hypothetical protein